jgi:hypothetical protein
MQMQSQLSARHKWLKNHQKQGWSGQLATRTYFDMDLPPHGICSTLDVKQLKQLKAEIDNRAAQGQQNQLDAEYLQNVVSMLESRATQHDAELRFGSADVDMVEPDEDLHHVGDKEGARFAKSYFGFQRQNERAGQLDAMLSVPPGPGYCGVFAAPSFHGRGVGDSMYGRGFAASSPSPSFHGRGMGGPMYGRGFDAPLPLYGRGVGSPSPSPATAYSPGRDDVTIFVSEPECSASRIATLMVPLDATAAEVIRRIEVQQNLRIQNITFSATGSAASASVMIEAHNGCGRTIETICHFLEANFLDVSLTRAETQPNVTKQVILVVEVCPPVGKVRNHWLKVDEDTTVADAFRILTDQCDNSIERAQHSIVSFADKSHTFPLSDQHYLLTISELQENIGIPVKDQDRIFIRFVLPALPFLVQHRSPVSEQPEGGLHHDVDFSIP